MVDHRRALCVIALLEILADVGYQPHEGLVGPGVDRLEEILLRGVDGPHENEHGEQRGEEYGQTAEHCLPEGVARWLVFGCCREAERLHGGYLTLRGRNSDEGRPSCSARLLHPAATMASNAASKWTCAMRAPLLACPAVLCPVVIPYCWASQQ